MRWPVKKISKLGDKRKLHCFAYLPKRVEDMWIWLETYISYQRYECKIVIDPESFYDTTIVYIPTDIYNWKEYKRGLIDD